MASNGRPMDQAGTTGATALAGPISGLRAIKTSATIGSLSSSSRFQQHLQEIHRALAQPPSNYALPTINSNMLLPSESDPEYPLIVSSNAMILEIDEEISLTTQFILQIYSSKFPELATILPNKIDYVRVVQRIGNEMDLTMLSLDDLGLSNSQIMILSVASSTTSGQPLSEKLLKDCMKACEDVLKLHGDKTTILSFLEGRMGRIAPNLCALIGDPLELIYGLYSSYYYD